MQEALIEAAVLAPSAHNSQPWAFRVGDGAIDLYATANVMGAVDPFDRELHVGLGCALENLLLAAAAHGYRATTTLLPEPGHIAHVALTPGPVAHDPLYDAIPHRHTDRSAYDVARPVPAALLEEMAALARADTRLVWVDDVGPLMVDAAKAVAGDEAQSRDGFALVREGHEDGLTLDSMAMSPLMTAVAKRLPASRRRADRFWVRATKTQTRTAAAFGFVAVPDAADARQRIEGGRLLQRVHLFATAHGLALQHMNQLTERADRERQLGLEPVFGSALHALMPEGWEALAAFRVGYAKGDRGRRPSPRRPAAAVLT